MDRVFALVWLRWRIWRHGLRTVAGVSNMAARVVMTVLGGLGALGMTAGCGLLIWMIASTDETEPLGVALAIVLYLMLFFMVVVPLFFGGFRTARDVAPLAALPISCGALYRLSLAASAVSVSHVFWYPALAVVGLTLMIVADVDPLFGGCLLLALVVVYVVWSHTLLHLLGLLLGRRRVREVVTVAAMVVLVVVSVIPAAIQGMYGEDAVEEFFEVESVPAAVTAVARYLPPSLAADGLLGLVDGSRASALPALSWLGVWTIVGLALGWRLFRRQMLEPDTAGDAGGSAAVGGLTARISVGFDALLDRSIDPPLAAVAAKDLRYLFRSTLGRLALVFAPIIAVIAGLAFADPDAAPVFGIDVSELTFIGMFLYVSILTSNFVINSFAWDGNGVSSYFLSPITPSAVIVGKNLAVWLFSGLLVLESTVAWAVTRGLPGPSALLSGFLVFASTVLGLMIVGNHTSVMFPVRRLISSANNSPSQTAILIMLVVVVVNAVMTGILVLFADLVAGSWLRPVVLALYVGAIAAAYVSFLRPAAALLQKRRENLAAALEGGEHG